MRRAARALTPVALFGLAFAVRLLPWPTVVGEGRVVFFGMDSWYHMRRVLYALASGGRSLTFDPYVNFPVGAKPIWPALFDGLAALLLSPVYAFGSWHDVELAAALLPPALGAVCVVVTWRLAQRLFPAPIPLLAGLMLSLLSAHFWYAQAGFLDHHVAIALSVTLLLASATRLLLWGPSVGVGTRAVFGRYVGVGVFAAFALLLWPGAVLHVGLVAVALLCFGASRVDRGEAAEVAFGSVVAYGTAFALVAPSGLTSSWPQWGLYSPVVLSRFQPWMFAGLALQAAGCALLWRHTPFGATRGVRAVQGLGIGVGLLAVSAIAFPGLLAGVGDAWGWFAKDEVFQSLVSESKPLFVGEDGFDTANALLRLSRFVWVFPLAVIALGWRAARDPKRPALLLLLGWAVVLAAATLLQRRFFNSFSPAFAIISAWAVVEVFRALRHAVPSKPLPRLVSAGVCVVSSLWLFAPTLAAYRLPLENLRRASTGDVLRVPPSELERRRVIEAAEWLRQGTPPTSGYLDADATPEYGVLAPWGYGHLLKYIAQRPTVIGNFGDDVGERNLRRGEAYFRSPEPDAIRVLEDLEVRYVLVETLAGAGPQQLARNVMRSRLTLDDSPGLTRHRLLWESPLGLGGRAAPQSELRIFELVRGAVVEGTAPPGAHVLASLRYESNRGRLGVYQNATEADPAGRYRLRVPYGTHGSPPGVATDRAYVLRAEGQVEQLAVSEESVREGFVVAGPSFGGE